MVTAARDGGILIAFLRAALLLPNDTSFRQPA
jgi:hypothetical protein